MAKAKSKTSRDPEPRAGAKRRGKARKTKRKPATAADAEIVLKVYDLRREAVMRASRDTIVRWVPRTFEDLMAVAQIGSESNAAFRQVSSYFELVYGLARHGAVNAELLAEWCGEGLLLFAKVHPYLDRFRAETAPTAFANAEWIVDNTEYGAARFALFQRRLAAMASETK